MGDLVRFEFAGSKPIKAEDEYRSGLKVAFVPLLGARRLQLVTVDLVIDQIPCGEPEMLTPADRIEVEGAPVFDYRVYPIANSVADKLCGIIEMHDGRPSSRVKDLGRPPRLCDERESRQGRAAPLVQARGAREGTRAAVPIRRAGLMAGALLEELQETGENHGA